jgi:hypothetical protein
LNVGEILAGFATAATDASNQTTLPGISQTLNGDCELTGLQGETPDSNCVATHERHLGRRASFLTCVARF